ncbi:MAG: hypothetical protein ACO1OB_09630 [Archangium sp.]
MIPFTLQDWLRADVTTRPVIIDSVLEHLPAGYRLVHGTSLFPQFVHEPTGVTFNALLGGEAHFGMTERRWQRATAMRAMWGFDAPVSRSDLDRVSPAREVLVDPALFAVAPLSARQLETLGLSPASLKDTGFDRTQLHAVLQRVTQQGWRAPSEAEWEFALRATVGDVVDGGAPSEEALGRRVSMGAYLELCRDDFHPTLHGYPRSGSRGDGHEVLRGGTDVLVRGTSSAGWAEALWPGRWRLADVSRPIVFRPWVDLAG